MINSKQQGPATFLDKIIAAEEYRHAARMKEIKQMSTKLVMLEPAVRALEAQGLRLSTTDYLHTYDGSLHLASGLFDDKDGRLYNALVDLDFKEVKRLNMTIYEMAQLKKDRLLVSVSVPLNHQYPATPASEQKA